jgi:hypothetical protein
MQISKVWTTKDVILLEKDPSTTLLHTHSINMPRLFSLSNPLDEMCPVLIKTSCGINYLTEGEQQVIFTHSDTNLVLMFDARIGKHLVYHLRKANGEEIAAVSGRRFLIIIFFVVRVVSQFSFSAFNETNLNSFNYTGNLHSTGNVTRANTTKNSCR